MADDFLVDPTDPTKAIHKPTARMAGSLFAAPIDASHPVSQDDIDSWVHIGFTKPDMFGKQSIHDRQENER